MSSSSSAAPGHEYLAHAGAFAVVFVLAKVVLLLDLCMEAY